MPTDNDLLMQAIHQSGDLDPQATAPKPAASPQAAAPPQDAVRTSLRPANGDDALLLQAIDVSGDLKPMPAPAPAAPKPQQGQPGFTTPALFDDKGTGQAYAPGATAQSDPVGFQAQAVDQAFRAFQQKANIGNFMAIRAASQNLVTQLQQKGTLRGPSAAGWQQQLRYLHENGYLEADPAEIMGQGSNPPSMTPGGFAMNALHGLEGLVTGPLKAAGQIGDSLGDGLTSLIARAQGQPELADALTQQAGQADDSTRAGLKSLVTAPLQTAGSIGNIAGDTIAANMAMREGQGSLAAYQGGKSDRETDALRKKAYNDPVGTFLPFLDPAAQEEALGALLKGGKAAAGRVIAARLTEPPADVPVSVRPASPAQIEGPQEAPRQLTGPQGQKLLPAPELPKSDPPTVTRLPVNPAVDVTNADLRRPSVAVTRANLRQTTNPVIQMLKTPGSVTAIDAEDLPAPVSAAGKLLHAEDPIGPNNTLRHADGTFAPTDAPLPARAGTIPAEELTDGTPTSSGSPEGSPPDTGGNNPADRAARPADGRSAQEQPPAAAAPGGTAGRDGSGVRPERGNISPAPGERPGASGGDQGQPAPVRELPVTQAETSAPTETYDPAPLTQRGLQASYHPATPGVSPPAVLLNDQAYNFLFKSLGRTDLGPEHKGVTITPAHIQVLKNDLERSTPTLSPTIIKGRQDVITTLEHGLRQNDGRGIGVVRVHGQTDPASVPGVASHEHVHVVQQKYRMTAAGQTSLQNLARTPHLRHAFNTAAQTLRGRGYAPHQVWREIPAWVAGGHSRALGLTDGEGRALLGAYAQVVKSSYGGTAVQEMFGHGSDIARSVAADFPPTPHDLAPSPHQNGSDLYAPDDMRMLTGSEIADVRRAGLLSSPKQIVKAVAGHVAALGMDEIAHVPASVADILVSAATGKDRTIGNVRLQDMMQAARVGATEGVKLGWRVMRKGAHGTTSPVLANNHAPFASGNRVLDTYVNGVFNMHEGAYAGLRLFALHRSLLELADVGSMAAVKRGVVPKSQQAAFRKHLYDHPTGPMMAAAVAASEEKTLTNSNEFSRAYQAAYDKTGQGGKMLMAQVMPFPKIESNIAGRSLEMAGGAAYGPLRFAYQTMKQHGFTADQQRSFGKTFGRGTVGLGLIALGVMIAAKGKGQKSDEKRHNPGAVEAGGKLYPTNTVAPASNLLQLGIDLYHGRQDKQDATASVGNALASLLKEQPAVQANPGDLVNALTSGADAKRQLGQQAGSFVPALLADIAAQGDTVKRKQTEPLDFVKDRIPVLRETLPPSTDMLGNTRPEVSNRLLNPFGGTPVGPSDTPAMMKLSDLVSDRLPQGDMTPQDRATMTLKRGLMQRAAGGENVSPDLRKDIQAGTLTLAEARTVLRDAKLPPAVRHIDALPLSDALDVYEKGTAAEKQMFANAIKRKLVGAARGKSLKLRDFSRAQALGLTGP